MTSVTARRSNGDPTRGLEGQATAKADQEKVRVGLLGVGLMGSAMAHRLLDQGINVVAWDRESDHLRGLEDRGGEPAKAPGEVLRDANTMALERRMATTLGMKVSILHKKGAQSGVFQVFYQTLDQLDDILERLNR